MWPLVTYSNYFEIVFTVTFLVSQTISLLLTLVLGIALDSCNNNDILLVVGYNYNLASYVRT